MTRKGRNSMSGKVSTIAVHGLMAALIVALPATVQAQAGSEAWPSRAVRIVAGFPPGGSTDIIGRTAAQGLAEAFRQPFVVENQPGASTAIAATAVARAAPDGYTLLVGVSSTMTINPVLYPNLSYSPDRDLRPVTIMGSFPLILAVNPALPVTTVRELIDYSRRPEQQLNYSTASVAFQLATEMFKQMSGARLYHVPYKGSSQAMLAVLSGDVQAVILDGAPLVPHMQSGRLRALAVTSATRSPLYPMLPTVAESGVPDYQVELWIGLFAPARTPGEIVAKLQAEIARIMQRPEVREKFARLGIEARGDSTEQTAAMIRAEAVRFAAIIRSAGIKPE